MIPRISPVYIILKPGLLKKTTKTSSAIFLWRQMTKMRKKEHDNLSQINIKSLLVMKSDEIHHILNRYLVFFLHLQEFLQLLLLLPVN